MRKLGRILLGSAALLVLSLGTYAAHACECLLLPTCGLANQHDSMFLGRAISEKTVVDKEHGTRYRVFRFVVTETFKGPERIGDQIDVGTGMGGGDCGYGFTVGERYLVDAFVSGNQLRTGICGQTAPEKRASVLIRELRSTSSGERIPDLSGRVAIDSNGAYPITGASKDLPGIPVVAKDMKTGSTQRAVTDSEGIYTFRTLEAGVYQLSLELPGTFTTDPNGLATQGPPLTITVPTSGNTGAACRVSVNVYPTGRILGTVTDRAGRPLKGYLFAYPTPSEAPLELHEWASSAQTGEDGRFALGGLRAGGYNILFEQDFLAANTASTRKPLESYYPGTPTIRDAAIVQVNDGGPPAVISFELKY